jgi:hypothetical protein
MNDSMGLALTGANAAALDRYEQALHDYLCFSLDSLTSTDAVLAAAPELVMGHALRAYLFLNSTEGMAVPLARQSLHAGLALPQNERETMHLRAVAQWCAGQPRAAARTLEDISIAYPRDVLALKVGQLLDYASGDSRLLHDRIARARPHWSAADFGFHAVLGMLAFGLEENGHYAAAEKAGREAVALQPRDAWAQHAVAHVLEMQDRRDDGIAWMRGQTGWQKNNALAVHNWWHLALHHLGQGDTATAIELYDGPVRANDVVQHFEMGDAAALLWRLQLLDVPLGERWQTLAQRWAPLAGDGWMAFNDWHAVMTFAAAGRDDLLKTRLGAQADALMRGDDNSQALQRAGLAASHGFIAYAQQDWGRAIDLLRTVRSGSHAFGGSHAQRDLIDLTLIEAARRGGQTALADALRCSTVAARSWRSGRRRSAGSFNQS